MRFSGFRPSSTRPIFHYSVSGGFDVDFRVQTRPKTLSLPRQFAAIEVQSGRRFKPDWTKGLNGLVRECSRSVQRGIIVYQGADRLASEGIDIMPMADFFQELSAGRLL